MKRSKAGCWTCKQRKKKCDEGGPPCERCTKAGVDCLGYGEKPTWLVRSSNAKRKKTSNLEDQIDHSGKSTITSDITIIGGNSRSGITDSSSGTTSTTPGAGTILLRSPSKSPNRDHPSFQNSGEAGMTRITSIVGDYPNHDRSTRQSSIGLLESKRNRLKEHEAELLLHYLEKIFPLQWQYYEGPNAWILPLLRKSKALYHSALSISATHMALEIKELDDDLQMHHQLTLQELRSAIITEQRSREYNIQSLAAVVMLVSFELFQGGHQNWQHHLIAGVTLVSIIDNAKKENTNGSKPLRILDDDSNALTREISMENVHNISHYNNNHNHNSNTTTNNNKLKREDARATASLDAAEKFLTSCVIWMDLISTASTGLPCQLKSSYLDKLVESNNTILPLEELMGCRLDVLVQLNEVSKLRVWKTNQESSRRISDTQLANRASSIKNILNYTVELAEKTVIQQQQTQQQSQVESQVGRQVDLIRNTTSLFALAISVYLHGVISGFSPDVPEIEYAVEKGILLLGKISETYYRNLVFPICVLGSMSKPQYHDYFSRIFGDDPTELSFGNIALSARIMQHTWVLRGNNSESIPVSWLESMKDLGLTVLLV